MRTTLLLAAGVAASAALVAPAMATTPTLAWDGQRGLDATTACASDETPYLHWVLTPGGKTKVPTAGTSLTVYDGSQVETVHAQREGNGMGAIHFYTGYFDPAGIDSAVADLGGPAAKNAHLTISSGCFGTTTPPVVVPDDPNPLPCNVSASATGTAGLTTNVHDVGATSGIVTLHAKAYGVPDRFVVKYEGVTLLDETIGTLANSAYATMLGGSAFDPVNDKIYTIPFSGNSQQVTVEVHGSSGTVWDYAISCAAPATTP